MNPTDKPTVIWRKPDGSVVSCHEKVKVLNENYAELQTLLQDLSGSFDLAVWERQFRERFTTDEEHQGRVAGYTAPSSEVTFF